MWRLKPNVKLQKKNVTYFSPGGYTFTHKSGNNISFDFCESEGTYEEEDGLFDFNLKEIDDDFITDALKQDNLDSLVQEQYPVTFFKDGKLDLTNDFNEMHCCIDLKIDGEIVSEVDFTEYVEPVYLAVFDPYNVDGEPVILLNKLTEQEHTKYFN